MIPILFESNELLFIANGLGRLNDAVSCYVTEQRNGEYELEMEYPVTGAHFDLITEGRIIYAKHSDMADSQPFVIYSISRPINGVVTINAEHISYRTRKEIVKPFTAGNVAEAINGLDTNAIDCPFTFYTDKSTEANFKLDHPETIRKVLGGMEGSILDAFGGEYEWNKFAIRLLANRGVDNGVTLRYGKNITDFTDDTSTADIFTACTPYYKNGDNVKYITSDPVVKSQYYDDFPYGLTVSLDCTQLLGSDDPEYVPTDEQLRNCALNYMTVNNSHLAKESIKVSFVPLYQTEEYKDIAPLERVNLCDWVTVKYELFGIDVKMKVTETVYDVLLERYKSITLGESTRTLAKTVNNTISQQVNESASSIVASLDAMRTQMLGIHDSFKYEETDADGNVIATYYMDTNDKATAQNVMRIDSSGIYFSQTGVTGTFTSAWAINGVFNAAFIQTGTMLADRIRGGVLEIGGLNNTSGIFHILDSEGTVVGSWDKDGLVLTSVEIIQRSSYSAADATKILQYCAGTTQLTPAEFIKYDMNLDGNIGPGDSVIVQNLVNGNYGNYITKTTTLKLKANTRLLETSVRSVAANGSASWSNGNGIKLLGSGLIAGGNGRTRIGDDIETQYIFVFDSVSAASYITRSKESIKKNIKPLSKSLDKVKLADICTYDLKAEKKGNKHIGMVLGDDYNVPEEIIRYDKDGEPEGIDLYSMCSMLWKAVQELSAKVDDLENKK